MAKIIKFIKENKIAVLAMLIIALTFAFLALPKFAHFIWMPLMKKFNYVGNGYQFIFNKIESYPGSDTYIGKCVGAGIAAIVMLGLAFLALPFSKKTSFGTLIAGLDIFTVSVLFFTMGASARKAYPNYIADEGRKMLGWQTYFIGSILLIAGILVIYLAVNMMKNEVKRPAKPKGPTYSYLKK